MMGELGNHIWQSTVFALLIGITTLLFRKNRAAVRYWLWLSASLKFLIPFSVLMMVGTQLEWKPATQKIAAAPTFASAVVQMSEPFSDNLASAATHKPRVQDWRPLVVFSLWACGALAIGIVRLREWRRVRATVASSTVMEMPAEMEVRCAPGLLEPGVVGLFQPILLLPEGIAGRLEPAQLKAVLGHELCHARRRDNLTSALHMIVETLFWFHPGVWWIGTRLVEERERACDEAVLSLGNRPADYAEGILHVCKNYVESPLACVAGVTGSDLKKRVQAILTGDVPGRLNFAKKLSLGVFAVVVVSVPLMVGIVHAAHVRAEAATVIRPKFEVASIRRTPPSRSDPATQPMGVRMELGGRLRAQNAPLALLIQRAYGVQAFQVVGGPAWENSDGFDIQAKPEGSTDREHMLLMLQALLAERFKLTLHHETRRLPVYDLQVAKGGPKLPAAKDLACVVRAPGAPITPPPAGQTDCGYVAGPFGRTQLLKFEGDKIHMADFIDKLEWVLGRSVVDQTGFTRDFALTLSFTADESTTGLPPWFGKLVAGGSAEDRERPNVFTALQEQLGLKLVSVKGPVDVLVIDHVERPTEN